MKSIRGKLFLGVGLILLIVAALNFFIPRFFVAKDINKTSKQLLDKFGAVQGKIQHTVITWVSNHFIQQAAQLEAFSRIIERGAESAKKESSLWALGAELIAYDPSLSFVQITDKEGNTATIAPENGTLYSPLWAPLPQNMLLIQVKEKGVFLALPEPSKEKQKDYFLYPVDKKEPDLIFKTFDQWEPTFSPSDTPDQMYAYLAWKENLFITKAEMIQQLAPWQEKQEQEAPVGMLTVEDNRGFALFSEEVFLHTSPLSSPSDIFLLPRENGEPYLDLAHTMQIADLNIVLAFSFSTVAQEIANILQKPIILSDNTSFSMIFPPGQKPSKIGVIQNSTDVEWEETSYQSFTFQLDDLYISILTPTEEAGAISKLMRNLQHALINKISVNLLIAALIILLIALLLLARISKRITRPITQLAKASEEIGEGKFEEVKLPDVEKREDEITVLTHSFEGMVVALRDREKIRGVLNKVVSKEVASEILKSNIELGGEERVVTLLFSDIRNFTPLSNDLPPKEVIAILNEYMTRMCHILDETEGVVDKFVGDEIMALYGAPLALDHHADKGVEAALMMIQDLKQWNQERQAAGKKIVEVGIAVHTGPVCTGNMGAENRLNYTVIGAHVNLASRLCAAAKPMQILISQETKNALSHPEKQNLQALPPMTLKGFIHPVTVYEVTTKIS